MACLRRLSVRSSPGRGATRTSKSCHCRVLWRPLPGRESEETGPPRTYVRGYRCIVPTGAKTDRGAPPISRRFSSRSFQTAVFHPVILG